jgi:putative transposase
MRSVIVSLLVTMPAWLRDRAALQLEILALRHQLQVLERTRPHRVRLTRSDRPLWIWLSRVWRGWRSAVVIVKPETVLAWHRRGFRLLWTWKSRRRPADPRFLRTSARSFARRRKRIRSSRTHLSLAKDSPQPRPIAPPTLGPVVAIPQVGGLHHRYDRRAA